MFCGGFGGFGGYGFGPSGSTGLGWMSLMMGFRILLFIGLIIIAVRLFRSYLNTSDNTMRIINEKFAKGEISEEEYLRRKTILSQRN